MKVAIIGGSGYGAVELARLLYQHPYVEVLQIISHSQAGTIFSEIYPQMVTILDQPMADLKLEKLTDDIDVVFLATPSDVSHKLIPKILDLKLKCIDLSGDFRLKDPAQYQQWYGFETTAEKYLNQAVYGLSEIYQEEILDAQLIANPGCYPTAALLALIPAIDGNLISFNSIIIDGKTGVSGAGRGLSLNVHFSEMNENTKAYQLGVHKHIPEIEQILSEKSNDSININFTPHIVPMTRGMMTTIYTDLLADVSQEQVEEWYECFYQNHPFIRVRKAGQIPSTKEVYGSNYCDIGLHVDKRTNKLMIVSVIDNLMKGAAGQAIQNLNLMSNWDQQTGLADVPIYP
ncbi:N-acetyl-gamma-glutamyl-phosphate reductase [Amphibacillus sp. Q70]|uniref:N-acetyl-gamma-glutamyl-phosphate reductase n=1 Tax=Amphibacillus sp. Q70 TaxID=3453416 RepID=UPI003F87F55E